MSLSVYRYTSISERLCECKSASRTRMHKTKLKVMLHRVPETSGAQTCGDDDNGFRTNANAKVEGEMAACESHLRPCNKMSLALR